MSFGITGVTLTGVHQLARVLSHGGRIGGRQRLDRGADDGREGDLP